MTRDDRITARPCVSCNKMFGGKSWMVRCSDCYRERMEKDEGHARAVELNGGSPLDQRPCFRCNEPYFPRYGLDIWCSNCLLEAKIFTAKRCEEKVKVRA